MSELLSYLLEHEESFRKTRLPALYSDFRQQATLNPDGFQANVHAWKRGLSSAALAGHVPSRSTTRSHLVLDLDDSILNILTSPQYGRPLALGSVLNEAVGTGEMMPVQQFLKATQSIYQRTWGSVPLNVLSWGLRQVGVLGAPGTGRGSDKIPNGQFVVLSNLESTAKAFLDATRDRASPFERVFSKAQFRRTFGDAMFGKGQQLSDVDMEVLICHLTRDKPILSTNGAIIKIRSGSGPDDDNRITEEDTAIASLKDLIEDLTKQTDILSRRVEELSASAQDAVRRKNRVSALAALKSKKLAEVNLERRHATLYQLEEVAVKISQAADNVAMVRVMQSSTSALKSLNGQVGGADKVDEVLDALREQMGEVDEVGNVIADTAGVYSAATVDETEVDDEFEAMLAEERRKEDEAQRIKDEAASKTAAQQEAEETRKKLAELEKLGPVPAQEPEKKEEVANERPVTPATAAAQDLEKMDIGAAQADKRKEDPVWIAAE
ncbi:Snf7-domain-containing protein [Microdochium bolleyi]|uniref:Snf7-domain-containing protein n=1 Tax=Microdochium bolleyi TaxID=196109 RepID=A0A136IW89_9PEZI|nr:Snf7-domain-containing protein [Microdochium bolleyi]